MFDLFGTQSLGDLRELRFRQFATSPCTSWYGHRFNEMSANMLACSHCGQTKKITSNQSARATCSSWNGHSFKVSEDHQAMYCKICGTVASLVA